MCKSLQTFIFSCAHYKKEQMEFKKVFTENETEVLNELISKWKYLYEIQFSYTDWTFTPKALRQDQVRERAGKIKILRVGPMWMRDGWWAPGTVLSFQCSLGSASSAALFSHVKKILSGTFPKSNAEHHWELKPAGTTEPVTFSYRHIYVSPEKKLTWIPKVSSLMLASTRAKACQQQQRNFRTKCPAVILERLC